MSKVKILVVGGTGYLGQHLLQAYAHANANANISGTPFVFDLAFTHHTSPPPHPLLDAVPSSLPFQVDLKTGLGFEAISNTFGQPDVVVNCAAISVPRACEIDPATAHAINMPSSLVKWLQSFENRTTLLIHLSTDQVYEGEKSFYKEEDIAVPVNVYGKTKVAAEQFISENYPNFAILRSSIIYGPQTVSPVPKSLPIQEESVLGMEDVLPDLQSENMASGDARLTVLEKSLESIKKESSESFASFNKEVSDALAKIALRFEGVEDFCASLREKKSRLDSEDSEDNNHADGSEDTSMGSNGDRLWSKKLELPTFEGGDPMGWIARAEKFFEVQEIPSFHKLQYAFMSMEGTATHWFYIWSQENPDSDWELFSTPLIKRFADRYGNHIFERSSILKQEKQTEMEIHIEEMETSTVFLKEMTNNESEHKQRLQPLVKNQEVKQELDGSMKVFVREAANSLGLQRHSCNASISELKHKLHKIRKSQEIILEEKRVKDEEMMETHPTHIKKTEGIKEIKMWLERWMEEQDIMLEDNITNKQSIQEETNAHSTKPHSFQDSDFHKKNVMMKQKSLLDPNSILKVVGTSMALESWNFILLGQPLALNLVGSMADSLAMELGQKERTEPIMLIKVIGNPPLSLPPPKPPDLSLHAGTVGRFQLSYKECNCLPAIRENLRKF